MVRLGHSSPSAAPALSARRRRAGPGDRRGDGRAARPGERGAPGGGPARGRHSISRKPCTPGPKGTLLVTKSPGQPISPRSRSSSRCGTRRTIIERTVVAAREAGDELVAEGEIDDYEVLIVDDASTDATGEPRRRAGRRGPPRAGRPPRRATASWAARSRPASPRPAGRSSSTPTPTCPSTCGEVAQGGPPAAHLRGRHRQRLPPRPHRRGPPPGRLLLRLQPPGPRGAGPAHPRRQLRLQARPPGGARQRAARAARARSSTSSCWPGPQRRSASGPSSSASTTSPAPGACRRCRRSRSSARSCGRDASCCPTSAPPAAGPAPNGEPSRRRPTVRRRLLIVNADDYGLTAGVSRGIVDAYRHGVRALARRCWPWRPAFDAGRRPGRLAGRRRARHRRPPRPGRRGPAAAVRPGGPHAGRPAGRLRPLVAAVPAPGGRRAGRSRPTCERELDAQLERLASVGRAADPRRHPPAPAPVARWSAGWCCGWPGERGIPAVRVTRSR